MRRVVNCSQSPEERALTGRHLDGLDFGWNKHRQHGPSPSRVARSVSFNETASQRNSRKLRRSRYASAYSSDEDSLRLANVRSAGRRPRGPDKRHYGTAPPPPPPQYKPSFRKEPASYGQEIDQQSMQRQHISIREPYYTKGPSSDAYSTRSEYSKSLTITRDPRDSMDEGNFLDRRFGSHMPSRTILTPRSTSMGNRTAIPLDRRSNMPYPEYYDGRSYNPYATSVDADKYQQFDLIKKLFLEWTPAGEEEAEQGGDRTSFHRQEVRDASNYVDEGRETGMSFQKGKKVERPRVDFHGL